MSNLTKDYMTAFLGVALLFIPLVREAIKSGNQKSYAYIIFLFIGCGILLYLGVDKINRDNTEKSQNDIEKKANVQTISDLKSTVQELNEGRKTDSASFASFLFNLENKYNIFRDPKTNQPVTYNTRIDNARDVFIGDR